MAKRVNSFSELFHSSPPESDFFEGLDEIIPPSILDTVNASMPDVPEPEPEPQAPIQAADPHVVVVAGPSQKRTRGPRTRFTKDQNDALTEFYTVNPHPLKLHRARFAIELGLTENKVYNWGRRFHDKHGIPSEEQIYADLIRRNEELMSKNEELQEQNQKLIDALHSGICPQCGGPVPHPDVHRSRFEVVPPEPLLVLSDDSIDMDDLRRDVRSLMPTLVERSSSHVPSDNIPGPAHDLVGFNSDLIADIVNKAKDELLLLAAAGFPLWIFSSNPSTSIHPETLNHAEYLRVSQRAEPTPYFISEASRHSATIHLNPTTIVQILMDVGQWLLIFCSLVTNAHTLEVLFSGIEESYKERVQVMSAEFLVPTHNVSTREVQFVRSSHQQLDGSWIVVDVSVDEMSSNPRPSVRSRCRKRPSGCLIRDLQNGSSFVTWVEHVDVREKDLTPLFKPFVESGFAYGAKRWLAPLQRHAERYMCVMGIHTSPSDSIISPGGRRSLAKMANQMAVSFFNDITNSTYHHWTASNKTGDTHMEVRTNKRRGDPSQPLGLDRTAGCSVKHFSHHTRIFDFIRDVQTRHLWDSVSIDSSVHVLTNFTTGLDPRNSISVLGISNHVDFLILQECFTDSTGSYVIYAPIDQATFQSMLCGVDPEPFQLMSSGFSILPDVSGDVLDGTLLTLVFQISVKANSARRAVDLATGTVQDTLKRIKAAVN